MPNRTKKALLGIASDTLGMIALTGVTLLATPLILDLTSETLYGFWIATGSILGYLALADLGIGMSITQLVSSKSPSQGDESLNKIANSGFFLFICLGILFLIFGLSFSGQISTWFGIPLESSSAVTKAYLIAVISGALALPLSAFSLILVGLQQMGLVNVYKTITAVLGIILSLVLLRLNIGLISLPLSTLFVIIANSSISYFYLKKFFPELVISWKFYDKIVVKKLLSFGGFFQLGRIANTVALSTDSILIAVVLGSSLVPIYSFSAKLPILLGVTLASKIPVAIFPAMTNMFANNEYEKLTALFRRLTFFAVRTAFLFGVILYIVNHKFVNLWVGEAFFGGYALNVTLILLAILDTFIRGITSFIYASGDLKKWTLVSMFEAISNLVLSIILINYWGLFGVALATLISKGITTGALTPILICNVLKVPKRSVLVEMILPATYKSLPSWFLAVYLMEGHLFQENLVWMCVVLVLVVLVNFVMFEAYALYKKQLRFSRGSVKSLLLLKTDY
jgi:O-antigen/teichoic acid export membrane protein